MSMRRHRLQLLVMLGLDNDLGNKIPLPVAVIKNQVEFAISVHLHGGTGLNRFQELGSNISCQAPDIHVLLIHLYQRVVVLKCRIVWKKNTIHTGVRIHHKGAFVVNAPGQPFHLRNLFRRFRTFA